MGGDAEGEPGGAGVVIFSYGDDDGAGGFFLSGEIDEGVGPGAGGEAGRGVDEFDLEIEGDGAFVDEAEFVVVPDGVIVLVVWVASHADDGGVDGAGLGVEHGSHDAGADETHDEVEDDSRAEDFFLFSGEAVEGIIADEPGGAPDFLHDVITGVDTGGAADALELEAVADVDTGGADVDAAVAVDAIGGVGIVFFATGLAAFFIVADDDGVVIGEGGLDAAVGAHDDAELFAEPGEAKVEGAGDGDDEAEGDEVGGGAFQGEGVEFFQRDKIGDEDVGDGGGGEEVEGVFDGAADDFFRGPGGVVAASAFGAVALDPAFDAAVDVIEEDGVGAGPAAPDPPEEGGGEEEGEAEAADAEEENPEVLGDDGEAEEVEAASGNIEKDGGVAVDLEVGKEDVDGDHGEAGDLAPKGEASFDIVRVEEIPRAVSVDGGDGIEVGVLVFLGHGGVFERRTSNYEC